MSTIARKAYQVPIMLTVSDESAEKALGTAIKLARLAKGWEQSDLAKSIHKSQTVVSKYERGESVISALTLQRIEELLLTPPNTFKVNRLC